MTHATTAPYEPVFIGTRKEELDAVLTRYPTRMAALLPALWMVQEARGWISEPAIGEVVQGYNPPGQVHRVTQRHLQYNCSQLHGPGPGGHCGQHVKAVKGVDLSGDKVGEPEGIIAHLLQGFGKLQPRWRFYSTADGNGKTDFNHCSFLFQD